MHALSNGLDAFWVGVAVHKMDIIVHHSVRRICVIAKCDKLRVAGYCNSEFVVPQKLHTIEDLDDSVQTFAVILVIPSTVVIDMEILEKGEDDLLFEGLFLRLIHSKSR